MISKLTLNAFMAESIKQDVKWGEQNHNPEVWMAILMEEVGELAQAVLADKFGKGDHDSHHVSMEMEAIQIGAVVGQFIEYLARRKINANDSA